MKTTEKILAYGALALSIVLTSCSKEVIDIPFSKEPGSQVSSEVDEGTQINVYGEVYTFDVKHEFPTTQLVLKFPALTKEEMGSKELRAYLISTIDGKEHLYQVPGFGANGDHAMQKSDKNSETVIDFVGLDGNRSISVPFGYYQKAKIILVDRAPQYQ